MRHRVSVIIPARNEAAHIRRCVESVLGQLPAEELEVIVADGSSGDDTAELAREAGARVVANPARLTPSGLNRALAAATGDVIVRFDAHGEMLPGYLRACLDALDEDPGVANVGGWCEPSGTGPWARATGAALASRLGVGNRRLWRRPAPGGRREALDTVHFGCWRAEVLRDAGGWNEQYARNQDFELNLRLRRAGGRVMFDPAIGSIYYPRESFRGLVQQYWGYGVFKGKNTIVVGAGPNGISVAEHLRARGVDTCTLGKPMGTWLENMPDGMFLKSEGFASNIAQPGGARTLREFAREHGYPYGGYAVPVPIELFRAYGLSLAERAGAGHRATMLTGLERNGGEFIATLADGDELRTRNVVVASGLTGMAYVPPELRELHGQGVAHSSEYVDADDFRGEVAIVGAGQSALELAALVLEHGGSPRVLVRQNTVRWNPSPRPERTLKQRVRAPRAPLSDGWKLVACSYAAPYFRHLPYEQRKEIVRNVLGPSGAWWLRDRLNGRPVISTGRRVVGSSVEANQVKLRLAVDGGSQDELYADTVVAATGYRVDIRQLPFLGGALGEEIARQNGAPVLSRAFESSVPGLFFVGLHAALTFGPVMRFVCGTAVAAEPVAKAIAARGSR